MNYDKLTDFEVNKAVAEALGYKIIEDGICYKSGTNELVSMVKVSPDGKGFTSYNFCHFAPAQPTSLHVWLCRGIST